MSKPDQQMSAAELAAECKRLERELCDIERRQCIGKAGAFDITEARTALHAAIDALQAAASQREEEARRVEFAGFTVKEDRSLPPDAMRLGWVFRSDVSLLESGHKVFMYPMNSEPAARAKALYLNAAPSCCPNAAPGGVCKQCAEASVGYSAAMGDASPSRDLEVKRQQFETWARGMGLDMTRGDKPAPAREYMNLETNIAWLGFKQGASQVTLAGNCRPPKLSENEAIFALREAGFSINSTEARRQAMEVVRTVEQILSRHLTAPATSIKAQAGEGWRPIEEAPRDGTKVDLWLTNDRGDGWRQCEAYYVRDKEWERPYVADGKLAYALDRREGWFVPNNDYDCRDGWCDLPRWFNNHPMQMRWTWIEPTHWMPIPTPPAMKEDSNE